MQGFSFALLTNTQTGVILYIQYIYNITRMGMMFRVTLIISNSSGKPIYEQITSQIKNLIISNQLKEGEALPSMRLLAKELRISVITTKRAYEDLERDGFIETITGKGSFVAKKNVEIIREQQLKVCEDLLQRAVSTAKEASISLEEMRDILTILYES